MELEQKKSLLEETVKSLLDAMGFKANVYTSTDAMAQDGDEAGQPTITVEIQLEDSRYLIGKHGTNLAALQHLLRVMIKKKTDEKIYFKVDVNGYRQEHEQSIKRLASETAQKVLQDKKSMVLPPMNAYERRLVHTVLTDFEGIRTESMGEGEDRKVVIKPAGEI